MHLVYLDESGNTGKDLRSTQQPIFLLAALIVPETCWQQLDSSLDHSLKEKFPQLSPEMEVHGTDLRNGSNQFRGISLSDRNSLRNTWLQIAQEHKLKLVYRAILKRRFEGWIQSTFGSGVSINPHIAAFPLVARVVDEYLKSLPGNSLGMFISDDNKEMAHDIEKSIKALRGAVGTLRLGQIVEKGFFIDSRKSRVLQLCDVCALTMRKWEESKIGLPLKWFDQNGVDAAKSLVHRGNEAIKDVLNWLSQQNNGP